jgi:parallel beta-helix repeat protein
MELRDNAQAADITIERNEIKLNASHGIAMTNSVWATIQHNDFILNNLSNVSNIWLETPFPGTVIVPADWDTLFAINNYWGRAYEPGEIGFIEDTVEDKSDDPALGTYVIVDPWENTPQPD